MFSRKIGLIGVSGYADTLLKLLLAMHHSGEVNLIAVVVINESEEKNKCRELRQLGCLIYPDCASFFAAQKFKLDLCIIPSPIHLHREMTVAALEAGMNVLVEKPLAATVEDVSIIKAASNRFDKFVAVGFQDLYSSDIKLLKSAILSGEIGQVRSISAKVVWPRNSTYYGRNAWAGRLQVNGRVVNDSPLNNANAHYLALILFLGGRTQNTMADLSKIEGELYRSQQIESFDTASLKMTTSTNIILTIAVSHSAEVSIDPEISVTGSKGSAKWRFGTDCIIQGINGTRNLGVLDDISARGHMLRQVVKHIDDSSVFICTPDIAEAHANLIVKLHSMLPIVEIPAVELYGIETNGATQICIKNIDSIVGHAYASRDLFSSTEAAWACSPCV
jgi:predicted dehydrogenase